MGWARMPTQAQIDRWYRDTVGRLELDAYEKPRRYRFKVVALALMGYGYLYLSLAVGAYFVYRPITDWLDGARLRGWHPMMLIAGVALLYSVLRALRARPSPAAGTPITAAQAPALFDLIDKVRKKLGAPALHQVFITDELNAGITQRPRLGVFGWHENALYLGLPYLMATDVRGLAATLAHEFAHLSGAHGKIGAWIYRVRASWARLMGPADAGYGNLGTLTGVFFALYGPYFSAYSFVLARQQEYEADAASRKLVGGDAAGRDLALMAVASSYLHEEFCAKVYREADTLPAPSAPPYRRMRNLIKRAVEHPKAGLWLKTRLAAPSRVDDTHPSLRDRLSELGTVPALPPPLRESAAETLFGRSLEALIDRFDADWRKQTREWWRRRHAAAEREQGRFKALSERVSAGTASVEEALEQARLVEQFHGADPARTAYEVVLARAPANAEALLAVGRLKLDSGREDGIALLERAAAVDADYAPAAAALAVPWLQAHGRYKDAAKFEQQAAALEQEIDQALDEAADVDEVPSVFPPALSPAQMAAARQVLEQERAVTEAYLVRRHVRSAPGRTVLVVALDMSMFTTGASGLMARVSDRLSLPHPFVIVPLYQVEGDNGDARRRFAEAVRSVRGAQLK